MRQVVDIGVLDGSLRLSERIHAVVFSLYFLQGVRLEARCITLVIRNIVVVQLLVQGLGEGVDWIGQ